MKPILIIVIITGLLNLFYTRGEGAPLVSFWIFTIYPEGIWAAVFMVLRIAMLITCTFLLTYTTSPSCSPTAWKTDGTAENPPCAGA